MKVAMKVQLSGSRNGVRWPVAGTVIDLPENEALELIEAKLATEPEDVDEEPVEEPVEEPTTEESDDAENAPEDDAQPVEEPEERVAPKPETRPARQSSKRGRR